MEFKKVSIVSVIACLFFGVMPLLSMQRDPAGSRSIFSAIKRGNIESINYWLGRPGFDVNAKDQDGEMPLMKAVNLYYYVKFDRDKSKEIVALLLDHKADIEAKDDDGNTALLVAAWNDVEIVKLLLDRTADIEATNNQGETALMIAASEGTVDTVKLLLERGADLYKKSIAGKDAFDYAENNNEILEALAFGLQRADAHELEKLKMPKAVGRMQAIVDSKSVKNRVNRAAAIDEEEKKEAGEVVKKGHTPTDIHYKQFQSLIDHQYPKAFADPIVKQCLQKEHQAYQEGNYVFYRSEPGKFIVYEYFIEELYRLITLYSKQASFIFTRFFKNAAAQQTINQYVDSISKSYGFLPEAVGANVVLSANIPLFGNISNKTSCTWDYFLENTSSEKISLKDLFEPIFDMYGFDKKYMNELLLIAQHIEKRKTASLQQIIVPKNLVDDVVMIADTGYCKPWREMIDESCWDKKKRRHTAISPILDRYVGDSSFEIDDGWQVRILMNAVYGLNPESGIKFHLYSRLPGKTLLDVRGQIKRITDILFTEWLEKELRHRGVSKGVEETDELGKVFSFLGKGEHTDLMPEKQQAVLYESYGPLAPESIQRKVDLGAQVAGQARVQAVFGAKNRWQHHKPASIWAEYALLSEQKKPITKASQKMKDLFISDCTRDAQQNKRIPTKHAGDSIARVATYNVHQWEGPKGASNYQGIFDTIKAINADVLVLQEVVFSKRNNCATDFKNLGYEHQVSMDTGNGLHNMIVSKYPFQDQRTTVYKVDLESRDLEKRNFINTRVRLPDGNMISVYGTHLDVHDESGKKREEEVKELLAAVRADESKNILLAADWNAVRRKDYLYRVRPQVEPQSAPAASVEGNLVWDLLEANFKLRSWGLEAVPTSALDAIESSKFNDSFTQARLSAQERAKLFGLASHDVSADPTYTVWTGTVVDFIFCAPTWQLPIAGSYVYYSSASDHMPVVMDIELQPSGGAVEQAAAQ
ncbi:MAG: ankyrin repeat domain-containing protein [Candidatus Dependentiae bacterium]|nr:ankyrin repeat domain-containing protein [Candidatus Dependentiae bacterium]